jgi:CubicO group peptidase (beta-lactamase class C family)
MSEKALVTAALAAFVSAGCGGAPDTSIPFVERLDRAIPKLLQKYEEPGLAVALVDEGRLYVRTFGHADRRQGTPLRADTVFNLGSISKTFTAWTVMTLVEAGRIQLDDPVDTHLKRWHLTGSGFDRNAVTVRRLLNHTAGISVPSVAAVDRGAPLPSLLDEINGSGPSKSAVQIVKTPGDAFLYSGGGYAILQLLVEDVTGRPFAEYARDTVFAPLGMTSTSFGWTPETAQRAATPYLPDGSVYRLREFSATGAAGLVSTAEDMGAFLRAHCAGPGTDAKPAVLKAKTLEQMWTEGVPAAALGRGARYGLGYNIFPGLTPVADVVGHGGSNFGWKSELLVAPARAFGIVLLTNAGDGKARKEVKNMFRDEVKARP